MLNALAAAAALLAVSSASPDVQARVQTPSPPETVPTSLEWSIEPNRDLTAAPGTVQFEIGYRSEHHSSSHGWSAPMTMFDGLTTAQLDAPGQPVAFTIRRDAGDFACKGVAGQGRGTGACTYAFKADFAPALAKRGVVGAPEPFEQFQLAMSDTGLAYVDELKRQGYAIPTVPELVKISQHGASLAKLKAYDGLGYRFGDVATLVKMTDHGVNPRYIQAMSDFGFGKLAAEQLLKMRDHGVSANYVTEMRANGFATRNPEELVRLRDHGVSSNYVNEMRGYGFTGLSSDDLMRLRDHGVTASYVAQLKSQGYGGLTPDALQRLRDHGVSADYIRAANRDGQHLSPDELIQRRSRGERD